VLLQPELGTVDDAELDSVESSSGLDSTGSIVLAASAKTCVITMFRRRETGQATVTGGGGSIEESGKELAEIETNLKVAEETARWP
jgi:hypothetical protein